MHTPIGNTREQQAARQPRSSTAPPRATGSERLRPSGSSKGLRVFALVGLLGFAVIAAGEVGLHSTKLIAVNLVLGCCVALELLSHRPSHFRIRNKQSNP